MIWSCEGVNELDTPPPGCAYFTRSKTVTRLPTGESRQVPSGVKRRLPLLYTVPSRLENWCVLARAAWMQTGRRAPGSPSSSCSNAQRRETAALGCGGLHDGIVNFFQARTASRRASRAGA